MTAPRSAPVTQRLVRVAALAAAPFLFAFLAVHGLELTMAVEGSRHTVVARYASEVPAGDAEVIVTAPADRGDEAGPGRPADVWQTGRTDPRGRFTFTADRPGEWRVSVDDGQGHRATLSFVVSVEPVGSGESEPGAPASPPPTGPEALPAPAATASGGDDARLWKLVAGLSLIAALTGVAYGVSARR